MDYKAIDSQCIMDYMNVCEGAVSVEAILLHSGAHKLRVYPILFELEQSGYLEVMEREELGAPLVVCKRRDSSINSE